MSRLRGLLPDLLLFFATVALAAWQRWSATDLVWSLWASSLLVGYSFIVVVLLVPAFRGLPEDTETSPLLTRRLVRGGQVFSALVGLVFFTFHFGFFHFVHSIFLNGFFPITPESVFMTTPDETAGWFVGLIGAVASAYWPFIFFSALSRRRDYAEALERSTENAVMLPYANVIRMHLMIFVFAGMHAAGLSGYMVYPVLVFYFFPFRLPRKSPVPEAV